MSASSATDVYASGRPSRARWTGNARINVGPSERLLSLASGGLMVLYGLSHGTTKGLLLAGVGAALAYRGATGHCDGYQALGLNSARRRPHTAIPSGQGVKIEESTI